MCIEAINGLKQGFSGSNDIWALLDQIWGSAQKIASTLLELDPSSYVKMDGGLGALFTFIGVAIALLITTFVFTNHHCTNIHFLLDVRFFKTNV